MGCFVDFSFPGLGVNSWVYRFSVIHFSLLSGVLQLGNVHVQLIFRPPCVLRWWDKLEENDFRFLQNQDKVMVFVLFGHYLAVGLMLRPWRGGRSLQILQGQGFGNGLKTH